MEPGLRSPFLIFPSYGKKEKVELPTSEKEMEQDITTTQIDKAEEGENSTETSDADEIINEETILETTKETSEDMAETSQESLSPQNTPKETKPKDLIPGYVDKLLAAYPNYKALYVDAKGGVYPERTQHNLIKDAILYQNPYYKL